MENKGRVRNILVSDLDRFKELLIRGLIRHNISYLQIENEFHCFDRIYRLYDIKEACKLIDEGVLIFGREEEKIRILSEASLMFARDGKDIEQAFLDFEPEVVEDIKYPVKNNNGIPSYDKRKVKRDNYMLNQKLKRNKR